MTELQLTRGATKWLRSLGLAAIALLVAAAVSVTSFLSAQSSADGSTSEIDYALQVNSANYASGANSIALGSQVAWEAWINPTSYNSNYGAFLGKEASFIFAIRGGTLWCHAANGSAWVGTWMDSGIPIEMNRWTHFGASMNGSSDLDLVGCNPGLRGAQLRADTPTTAIAEHPVDVWP